MSDELSIIKDLFLSMDYDNIVLGITLAESQNISLIPMYNELARVLSDCVFSPNVGWMNLPFHILLPQLQRIFTISLEYSTLTKLTETFGFLQGVYLLEIIHSDIAELPSTLSFMKRLKSFSLVDTPIMDLPMSLQELPNLQCLYLRQTKIKNIPKVIALCKQLHTLDISQNAELAASLDWDLLAKLNLQKLIVDARYESQLPAQYESIVQWHNGIIV